MRRSRFGSASSTRTCTRLPTSALTGHLYAGLARIDRPDRHELREWHEPTHANVDDDAAAIRLEDGCLDHASVPLHLLHLQPLLPIPDAAQREDNPAVRTLDSRHNRDDAFADPQLVRPSLMKGDHARGELTRIHGRLVSGHSSNGSFDGVAHPEWS